MYEENTENLDETLFISEELIELQSEYNHKLCQYLGEEPDADFEPQFDQKAEKEFLRTIDQMEEDGAVSEMERHHLLLSEDSALFDFGGHSRRIRARIHVLGRVPESLYQHFRWDQQHFFLRITPNRKLVTFVNDGVEAWKGELFLSERLENLPFSLSIAAVAYSFAALLLDNGNKNQRPKKCEDALVKWGFAEELRKLQKFAALCPIPGQDTIESLLSIG